MKRHILLAILLLVAPVAALYADAVYTIYPIPHSQKALKGKTSFTDRVTIVADPSVDRITIDRAVQVLADKGISAAAASKADPKTSNVYLAVGGSKGVADKYASKIGLDKRPLTVAGKFDRHVLQLKDNKSRAELIVVGENTDAVFCGLASLEQILDCGTKDLQTVLIEDYADIRCRGVVEGYYGLPYNADVTKDLFRFMARYKMNTYLYGAKSDPYHIQKWAEPYPDSISALEKKVGMLTSEMLRDMVKVSHENKVNFIWAVHPGQSFIDPDDDGVVDRIMAKYQIMYDLGLRQFGIFVDDVGVPYDIPTLKVNTARLSAVQSAVEERWNKNYSSPADTVKPVNFVPQLYAYSWPDAERRTRYYTELGKAHPQCLIYITGAEVWTVPNSADLKLVSTELGGRHIAWWWNYPCNDNDMTKLFVSDTYTNFADERWIKNDATLPKQLDGAGALLSNPMQQGEASKIALFGLGDYAWNNAAFDNIPNYKAAVKAVVGCCKASDFEYLVQYLRYYDRESPMAALVEAYKADGKSAPIIDEMTRLLKACNSIEQMACSGNVSDSLFVEDIRPWLNRLSNMAFLTIQMLDQIDLKASGKQTETDCVLAAKLRKSVTELDSSSNSELNVFENMVGEIRLLTINAESSAIVFRPFLDYLAQKLN